jgi:hypothetical protein
MSFPSWASRLALASAMAALALIAAPAAKADVVKKFDLSGCFNCFPFLSPVTFTGTIDLDFTQNTATFVDVAVDGLPAAYDQNPSLFVISGNQAVVHVTDGNPSDVLTLMFTMPTLTGFDGGAVAGSGASFGGGTGFLFDPKGVITPDPSNLPVPAPEPSTWAMMLLGFIGLGLAAKGRRAIRFLAGKA